MSPVFPFNSVIGTLKICTSDIDINFLKTFFFPLWFLFCFAFQPGSYSTPQAGPALTVWRRLTEHSLCGTGWPGTHCVAQAGPALTVWHRLTLDLQESSCLTARIFGFIHWLLPMLFYFYYFYHHQFFIDFFQVLTTYIVLEFLFPLSCVLWLGARPVHSCRDALCSACSLTQTLWPSLPSSLSDRVTHADHSIKCLHLSANVQSCFTVWWFFHVLSLKIRN